MLHALCSDWQPHVRAVAGRQVLEVNTVGTFNVLRLGAEKMAAAEADSNGERGCIINTAR